MKIQKIDHNVFLPTVTLFCMIVVGSYAYASTTPETYWKSVLPNTPMPLAVTNILPRPERIENKGADVGVYPKKRHVYAGTIPKSLKRPTKDYSAAAFLSRNKNYEYGDSANQLKVDDHQIDQARSLSLYFLEKEIKIGSHMTFEFSKTLNGATFLNRQQANSLPFSSDKMSDILRELDLKPDSIDAKTVEKTIKECERKANSGEERYCATSLESMVDFATSTIGKNIKAMSTIVNNNNYQVDKYTITRVKKTARDEDNKNMVCHKQDYAYAVFYCHMTTATSSYVVSLVGSNGSTVKALAICHKNTSGWNPKHLAFQVLNVKPGTVPVCHFLAEGNIIWVPNN